MSKKTQHSRRDFLKYSSIGLGSSLGGGALMGMEKKPGEPIVDRSRRLPREVWIASISQNNLSAENVEEMIDKLLARMEEVAPMQPDIICLPEVGPFVNLPSGRPALAKMAETAGGPITERFAEFAKKHRCYVWCPIYTKEEDRYYNALVLIDRQGAVLGEYRKMHPTVGEIEKGIAPGPLTPP
ncbi:MAG: carbon-nitrogen hydrolase family protein, partial [Gemmatimonadota bacterium]|nr:carbon-nitrogen hydrolase family protein [Gemmatimonadota bacterium]